MVFQIRRTHVASRILALPAFFPCHQGGLRSHDLRCPPHLPGAKDAVPQAANGREGVVAALVALMVPVMMMRHLGKGQEPL